MESCVFCKIIKGELASTKIYENADFLAFLTIEPVASGHLLLIPKQHIVWMHESGDEVIAEIFKLSKKLMLALKNATKCDFVQVAVVGKDVPHFHIHLIPRRFDDTLKELPTKKYTEGEAAEVAKKITAAL